MKETALPLSMVTLVFGVLSIPLAFARQLCVPALLMAVLALLFHLFGRFLRRRRGYGPRSIRRSLWGFRLAAVGGACALAMWVLWASNVLL
ncbi:MAG: hypothetical protein J5I62_07015 [Flavobacteriales bacterium]|nr:hypothetical protein [Flavobacteriales bacterium]MEB2341296.1 hypothetical protein [Flavobacteriia bacterium]